MVAGTLRSRRWGYVAAAWATLFAVLHLFWALGGSTGLASSAGTDLARQRPGWFVAGGLWGVGGLLLGAAALGVVLARSRPRGWRRRALLLAGAAVALLLLIRGISVEVLLLGGALDGNTAISPDQRRWSLLLWNPWFVAGGLAFGLAAAASAGPRRRQVRAGRRSVPSPASRRTPPGPSR